MGEIVDNLHQSDRHTIGIAVTVGINDRQNCFEHTQIGRISCTPFLVDNLTLGIYLIAFEQDTRRPIVQNKQTGIDETFSCRDIGNIIYRLIDRCIGIEVGTEFHTVVFEIIDNVFPGEMGCSIERHMFEEVCQTTLMLFFENGTYTLRNIELDPVFGKIVMAEVISKAVLKLTHTNGRIKSFFERLLGRQQRRSQQTSDKENFFHEILHHIGLF